jgi:AcrR family transcriptional regulator
MLSPRERILSTASDLFYRQGIHATGIDEVIEKSGVAKATLYNHFESKEALVAAALELRLRDWEEWFDASLAKHRAADAKQHPLLAIFDCLEEWFAHKEFKGCPFLKAWLEVCGRKCGASRVCEAYVRALRGRVQALVPPADAKRRGGGGAGVDAIVDEIVMLYNGAVVAALFEASGSPARRAKDAAWAILGG